MKNSLKAAFIICVFIAALNGGRAQAKPYTIQRGDKLYKIAGDNGVTAEDILLANPSIRRADLIRVGDVIEIPEESQSSAYKTYTVQKGDCLHDIAKANDVSMDDIRRITPTITDPSRLFIGQTVNIPIDAEGDIANQESTTDTTETPLPVDVAEEPAPDTGIDQEADSSATAIYDISSMERQVLDEVNALREEEGAQPLEWDENVAQIARAKSRNMAANNQLSHTSQELGSPFKMLRDNGISYKTASENIARGQSSAKEVVKAWMNSTGHRESMLNPSFTHMGVGAAQDVDGRIYWVQLLLMQ